MGDYLNHFTVLETIGAAFGVVQVLLSRKNNVNNYLFGIAGILIAFYIYYESKLYADILLSMYYLVMSIYGWFFWKFGKERKAAPISFSDKGDYLKAGGIALACFGIMAYWLTSHTDSDVPIWDAVVAAFAWAGMWLMAKRKLENWIFLNASNLVAIPLFIYKGLYVYAALTIFLFVVAISGYLNWKKIINEEKEQVVQ